MTDIQVGEILSRYEEELRVMTRRAILAETELAMLREGTDGDTVGE